MAPRTKQVVHKSKRPRVEETSERRSKSRNDPSGQNPTVQAPIPPSPTSERLAGRSVVPGRRFDSAFLDSDFPRLSSWISVQGWEKFCSMSVPFYPHLVREFYCNIRRGQNGFLSTVKGVEIDLNREVIGNILDLPCSGSMADRLSDRSEGFRSILESEDVRGIDDVSANQLSTEMRLLHHLIARIFMPKTGRFDLITEKELLMMHHLIKGLPLNLPGIIFHQMKEAATRPRVCLPFGMALTVIFTAFDIPLSDEPSEKIKKFDTYDEASLQRMGFEKINNQWGRRSVARARPVSPDSPPAPAAPSSPAPAPASTSSALPSESILDSYFQRLTLHLDERLDRFESAAVSRHISLSDRVAALEQSIGLSNEKSELAEFAREAALLRGRIESGITVISQEIHELRDTHNEGSLKLLHTVDELLQQVKSLLAVKSESIAPDFPSSSRAPRH